MRAYAALCRCAPGNRQHWPSQRKHKWSLSTARAVGGNAPFCRAQRCPESLCRKGIQLITERPAARRDHRQGAPGSGHGGGAWVRPYSGRALCGGCPDHSSSLPVGRAVEEFLAIGGAEGKSGGHLKDSCGWAWGRSLVTTVAGWQRPSTGSSTAGHRSAGRPQSRSTTGPPCTTFSPFANRAVFAQPIRSLPP